MSDSYGAAAAWVVIMMIIFVFGLLYMMTTPLFDIFIAIGGNNGSDPLTLTMFQDFWDHWLPIGVTMSLVVFGWRKSRRIVGEG